MAGESGAGVSRRKVLGGGLAIAGMAVAVGTMDAGRATALPQAAPSTAAFRRAGLSRSADVVRAAQADYYPDAWSVRPFPLTSVTLGQSVFTRAQQQALILNRAYSVDKLLAVFRRNAGLDTKGATPPGGWEEYGPNPDVQRWGPREYVRGQNTAGAGGALRGHYGGHFLSGLSMAYASTGEIALLNKVNAMVAGLEECRAALAAQQFEGGPRYSHPGVPVRIRRVAVLGARGVRAVRRDLGAVLHAAQDPRRAARRARPGRQRAGARSSRRDRALGAQPALEVHPGPARADVGLVHRRRVRRHERGARRAVLALDPARPERVPRGGEALHADDAGRRVRRGHRHAERQARQPAHPAVPGLREAGRGDGRRALPPGDEGLLRHGRPRAARTPTAAPARASCSGPAGAVAGDIGPRNAEIVRGLQHAQGVELPVLQRPGPEVHGLLRAHGAEPHPRRQAQPRVDHRTGEPVHVPRAPRCPQGVRQRQHRHLLRRHGAREPRQVPGGGSTSAPPTRPSCTSTSTSPPR